MVMRPISSKTAKKQEEEKVEEIYDKNESDIMIVAFHVDTWKEICRLSEIAGVTQGEIISDAIALLRDKMGAE